ncbi:MAG: T9SS type A sorting domain-containing protein [Brumimicrobium sp.]|nr:T9SS type A sorting domain-containing protein [Brumimicrobium sp.]MCO5267798.1 T9SS type A sorting domain-containing protein [Brumimicrobium sp.]
MELLRRLNAFCFASQIIIGGFIFLPSSINAQSYCTPDFSNGCSPNITIKTVNIQGETTLLDNSNSGCSSGSYGDFTSLTAPDLEQGNTYAIQIGTDYNLYWQIDVRGWLDLNNNGTFEESEEILTTFGQNLAPTYGTSNGMAGSNTSFNYTVPASTPTGDYRMRIRLLYNSTQVSTMDACTQYMFGESEDYMIHIGTYTPTPTCNGAPDAGIISSNESLDLCPDEDFILSATGSSNDLGVTLQWQQRIPAGTGTWTDISGATGTTLTVSGITDNTDYRLVTTCTPTSDNSTSNTLTVNLKPSTECGTSDINQQNTTILKIYPNPAKDKVIIENNGSDDVQAVSIYNIVGDLMLSQENINNIDVSHLTQGTYFITIQFKNGENSIRKLEIIK